MKSALEKNSLNSKVFFRTGVIALVLCALIIRTVYFFSYNPPLTPYSGDSPAYDIPAWNVVEGNGYVYEEGVAFAFREPGYALFLLVPTYVLFGHSVEMAAVVQLLLDIAMMLMVVYFLRKYMGERTALIGGMLYVLYLPFIFQHGEIMTEAPYQFWLLVTLFLFILALQRKSRWLIFSVGLALGYTALVRWGAIVLPFFLIVGIFAILRDIKKTILYSGLLLVGVGIVVAPWLVRNYVLFDEFIFGRIGGGQIYWSGSYIPFDGEWRIDDPIIDEIRGDLTREEYDKKFTAAAIENIKENPLGVAWIWFKKPFKIYLLPESINYTNRTGTTLLENRNPILWVVTGSMILLHWFILFIGLFGLLRNKKMDHTVRIGLLSVLIFAALIYVPLNPVTRYNVPIMALLIIPAAPVVYNMYSNVYKRIKKV